MWLCRQLVSSKLGLALHIGVKPRARLYTREEGLTSSYPEPYGGSPCPGITASIERSWRELRAHLVDALSLAREINHSHSNSNFWPGILTRDPKSQAGSRKVGYRDSQPVGKIKNRVGQGPVIVEATCLVFT